MCGINLLWSIKIQNTDRGKCIHMLKKYTECKTWGEGLSESYATKRQRESKNFEEYKQKDNMESVQYISKQANIQKIPMLCTNDDLPEVRHLYPDSRALELKDGGTGGVPPGRLC